VNDDIARPFWDGLLPSSSLSSVMVVATSLFDPNYYIYLDCVNRSLFYGLS
jgi:hypothetical protein